MLLQLAQSNMRAETGVKIFVRTIWVCLTVCGALLAWHGWLAYEDYKYYRDSPAPVIEKPIVLNQVYVINLDRSPERYAKIKENLDGLGIKHARFKAVDGYNLDIENDAGQQFKGIDLKSGSHSIDPKKHYKVLCPSKTLTHHPIAADSSNHLDKADPKIPAAYQNRVLSAGEYGCYCSHLGVWKEMIDKNINYALILEDDAHLAPESSQKLNQILKHAPHDFEIIYLYITNGRFKKFNSHINMATGHLYGQVAYILSQGGAKKLWIQLNTPARAVDRLISHLIETSSIKAYASINKFVTTPHPNQYPELSLIADMLPKDCNLNRHNFNTKS